MTLAAIVAAWFTQSAVRQRRVVAELTKLGADVLYEHKVDPNSVSWPPEFLRSWLGDDFFAEATEVRFGFTERSWLGLGNRPQNPINNKLIVLSDRSKQLGVNMEKIRRGFMMTPPAALPVRVITTEAMLQLRQLPHLRKLTLVASTDDPANAQPLANSYGDFVLDLKALQLLKDSPTLEEINLTGMPADDKLVAGLRDFRCLKRLFMQIPSFSQPCIRDLESLVNLEELAITNLEVPIGLVFRAPNLPRPFPESLPALAKLRELHIPEYRISDLTVPNLKQFPELQILDCHSVTITDNGLCHLASLPNLRELNLIDSQITDAGAEHLGKIVGLRKLILTNSQLTDEGLRHLAPLTKLERLYLPYLPITDAGLSHLRQATTMQELHLPGTKISDAGITRLSAMSELTSLDLSFTQITDASVNQLIGFKNLSKLRLVGTRVTSQGIARLRQALPTAAVFASDASVN